MSAFDISIDIADGLTAPLRRLKEAGEDLRQPFADIGKAMFEHTQDRFRQEFSPDGIPWEVPKRWPKDPKPTLVQSGQLYDNIDFEIGDDFAQVGVKPEGGPAEYARRHHLGDLGGSPIVARPFLGIESRDLTVTEQIILDHLANAAKDGAA